MIRRKSFLFILIFSIGATSGALKTGENEDFNCSSDSLLNHLRIQVLLHHIDLPEEIPEMLTNEFCDSLLYEEYGNSLSLGSGTCHSSPDHRFNIYVFDGEGCGAYCNPFWESYLRYELPDRTAVLRKSNFNIIDSIYQLNPNQYLLMESSYGRPASVYSVTCWRTSIITFAGDSVHISAIDNLDAIPQWICDNSGSEDGPGSYFRFDQGQNKIKYTYSQNALYEHGTDVDTVRTGSFRFDKDHFILIDEKIEVFDHR